MYTDKQLKDRLNAVSTENKLSELNEILSEISSPQAQIYLEKISQEDLVIQRSLIQSLIEKFAANTNVSTLILDYLQDKQLAFEVQISNLFANLANIHESEGQYSTAASYLTRIPLDSGTRVIQDDYKLEIYIRIVRLFLEDEDFVNADAFLNRAAMLVPKDKKIALQLTACQARSLDFKRQFVQSALKYLELSFEQEMVGESLNLA